MLTESKIVGLRQTIAEWRGKSGGGIGFVPTMGALHEGHLSLVAEAKKHTEKVVVSVFVNPTQFGPKEDFGKYPRQEAKDAALLKAAGADLLFLPQPDEIYPSGFSTSVTVAGLSDILEGAIRPGHFSGVATVVTKLLLQVAPDAAFFGEKDYQQLQVIQRLVRDLDIPVKIVGCPIIRDTAGLALSSRNAYLTPEELTIARQLNVVIKDVVETARKKPGQLKKFTIEAEAKLKDIGFTTVDYVTIVDPQTLIPLEILTAPARILTVARLGATRLLDNMPVGI